VIRNNRFRCRDDKDVLGFCLMDTTQSHSVFLVSSCLVSLCTRYDGAIKPVTACLDFLRGHHYIPVCPEQLGGLATPRPAADITGGDGFAVLSGKASVCTEDGTNVTSSFVKGAEQVLQIAQSQKIAGICLKARSPSCSVHGCVGVTAALLIQNGFTLYEF